MPIRWRNSYFLFLFEGLCIPSHIFQQFLEKHARPGPRGFPPDMSRFKPNSIYTSMRHLKFQNLSRRAFLVGMVVTRKIAVLSLAFPHIFCQSRFLCRVHLFRTVFIGGSKKKWAGSFYHAFGKFKILFLRKFLFSRESYLFFIFCSHYSLSSYAYTLVLVQCL